MKPMGVIFWSSVNWLNYVIYIFSFIICINKKQTLKSKELSLYHNIPLFFYFSLWLFFQQCVCVFIFWFYFPWLNQFSCFIQLFPSLLSYLCSFLLFVELYLFLCSFLVLLSTTSLCSNHAFEILWSFFLIEGDSSASLLLSERIVICMMLFTHLFNCLPDNNYSYICNMNKSISNYR